MPSHKVHLYIDKLLYGRTYPKIHRAMDMPYRYLGRFHRILFHDATSAYLMANYYYPGDKTAVCSAMSHILLDKICSSDKSLRLEFERLAASKKGKRKRSKTTGKPNVAYWLSALRAISA